MAKWRVDARRNAPLFTGTTVHARLQKAGIVERCLGYRELLAIQSKGVSFYRRHFGKHAVFGWRSVVRDALRFRFVPYLFEFGDGVMVHWYLLDFAWKQVGTAFVFA